MPDTSIGGAIGRHGAWRGAFIAPRSDQNRGENSVIKQWPLGMGRSNYLYLNFATMADSAPQFGTPARDRYLRQFYKEESVTNSAIYSTASRYAALEWTLQGPPKTVVACRSVLQTSQHGQGWIPLMMPSATDLLTQDNAMFWELVRTANSPGAPVVGINAMDSARCIRTGRWDTPVIYVDLWGKEHLMAWYQVLSFCENPSPDEYMRGMQVSAVSRILRLAQIMRDVTVYKAEKVSGQFNRQVNVISGVSKKALEDAIVGQREEAGAQGLVRYIQPIIMAALDPKANLSKVTVDLASLPDGWDEEVANRWFVNFTALALGADPQDIAPLPGHSMGSSQQSEMLHLKSRGKGVALFTALITQAMNYQGILPSSVVFGYKNQDPSIEKDASQAAFFRAQARAQRVLSGEITPAVAAMIAVDEGDLDAKYLPFLNIRGDGNVEVGASGGIAEGEASIVISQEETRDRGLPTTIKLGQWDILDQAQTIAHDAWLMMTPSSKGRIYSIQTQPLDPASIIPNDGKLVLVGGGQ